MGKLLKEMAAARRRVAQRIIEKGEVPKLGNEAVKQYAELYGLQIKVKICKYLVSEYNNPNSLIYRTTLGKENNAKKQSKDAADWQEKRATYLKYIDSAEWKSLRNRIIKQRGRKCEKCGQDKGEIHAHHLTYERFMNELESDIQLLCKSCHMAVHNKKVKNKRPDNNKTTKIVNKKPLSESEKIKRELKKLGHKMPTKKERKENMQKYLDIRMKQCGY